MGLQAIVRWFLPREDHFYGFLEAQADVAHEAALAVARFKGFHAAFNIQNLRYHFIVDEQHAASADE